MHLRKTIYHQRGEYIIAQGILPYKYEEERNEGGMTALAGLPVYLDLATVLGMGECIRSHFHVREGDQGRSDAQEGLSLILLNLAGGDCVEDIKILEKDEGFCKILGWVETRGRGVNRDVGWRGDGEKSVTVQFLPL